METESSIEGEIEGEFEGEIEGEIVVFLLEFPTQQILPPVSDFSSFWALGSTMFVIFCSQGCTTEIP